MKTLGNSTVHSYHQCLFRHLTRALCWVLLLTVLGACGGGTSGSDGGTIVRLQGKVTSASVAASGLLVTALESGDSVVTDSAGSFVIDTVLPQAQFTLTLQQGESVARLDTIVIPDETATVDLTLALNTQDFQVTVEGVSFAARTSDSGSTDPGIPTPTPAPSASPAKTPTFAGKSLFSGSVLYKDGRPATGIAIEVLGRNASATVDAQGHFSIEATSRAGSTSLRLRTAIAVQDVSLGVLPAGDLDVRVRLKIDLPLLPLAGDDSGFDITLENKVVRSRQ